MRMLSAKTSMRATVHEPVWKHNIRNNQYLVWFPDDISRWIFLNENILILIQISLKVVAKGQINNIQPLVRIMSWGQQGDNLLSEAIMF